MEKVNIDSIIADIIGVLVNNEGDNSPEDICDYVDSETLLDYMLNENSNYFSHFLNYVQNGYENKYFPYHGTGKSYYKVLMAMISSPTYEKKCEEWMKKYGFDLNTIRNDFR